MTRIFPEYTTDYMSGFGGPNELIHDLSIAGKIPGKSGERAVFGAVGAYAVNKLYSVLFDKETETWRDGKGNIVPPPSKSGLSNRPYGRGSIVETASTVERPYYDAKRRRWTDSAADSSLNSDNSSVVEAYLAKNLQQFQYGAGPEYKHHFTKEELSFIRKHYESTARGKKPIPVKSDRDAIGKYKAFMDYIRDKAPDGMFGRGLRGRVADEIRARRPAGSDPAAEDVQENFSRIESRRRAGVIADRILRRGDNPPQASAEPLSPAPFERTKRDAHGSFSPPADANILAPAQESFAEPVNQARDDPVARRSSSPVHLQFDGDDVPAMSADEALARVPAHRRSALGVWHVGLGRYLDEDSWKDTFEFERMLDDPSEASSSSALEPVRHVGLGRHLDEDHSSSSSGPEVPLWLRPVYTPSASPSTRPAPAPRDADAALPPLDNRVELEDNREPGRRDYFTDPLHEVEINDAPGAPYQGPGYFDIDPPKDVGVVPLGAEYQPPFALLHEEQVESNRKRRHNTRILGAETCTTVYYARCSANYANYGGGIGPRWALQYAAIPRANLASNSDDSWHAYARFGLLWVSSSRHALVPARISWDAGTLNVQFLSRDPDASVFSSGGGDVYEAYAKNFLTYVPPGLGPSQRLGCQVVGNYLQMRLLFSPAVYIPEQLVRDGRVVAEALPYSSVPVEFTSSGWPSSSRQYLFTVHRFIVVLTSNPSLQFKDVVVDETDVFSPISLHTIGVLEILKDSTVDGDRDISFSANVQLKQRPFYYTSLSPPEPMQLGGLPRPPGASPAELRDTGLTRGYHVLCLYASAVVSLPLDLYFADGLYQSRLENGVISPRCHMSYAFSYSDA